MYDPDHCVLYLLFHEFHGGTYRSLRPPFEPIDIAAQLSPDTHVFRCYTDCFSVPQYSQISQSQLQQVLEYGRLYQVYVPDTVYPQWCHNACYIRFRDPRQRVLFHLKYPRVCDGAGDEQRHRFLNDYTRADDYKLRSFGS